jgi:hypothetical protein
MKHMSFAMSESRWPKGVKTITSPFSSPWPLKHSFGLSTPKGFSPSSPGLLYSATLRTDAGWVATLKGLWPSSSATLKENLRLQSLSAVYIHLVFSTKAD